MIKRFIKGLLVGIAKIVPGISGSILAISLGIYYKSVNILNNFYKMKKEEIIYFLPIFLGVIVGVFSFSKIIDSVYLKFYLPITLLFLGFIVGDIGRSIIVNVKKDFPFYLFLILALITLPNIDTFSLKITNDYFLFTFLGFVEAFTMIIPGVSGTAILMGLNLYDEYLHFIVSMVNINFIVDNLDIIFIYSVSLIIGGYLTIKMVSILFHKFRYFDNVIRVLMSITIIILLKKTIFPVDKLFPTGLFLFLGLILAYFFNKKILKA